jgi:hypothetical protein
MPGDASRPAPNPLTGKLGFALDIIPAPVCGFCDEGHWGRIRHLVVIKQRNPLPPGLIGASQGGVGIA